MHEKPWGTLEGVRPSKQVNKLIDQGAEYDEAFSYMQHKYSIQKEKFSLLWEVCQKERSVLEDSTCPDLFSIYVGIPFCPTRCLYCSFPSHSLTELGKLRRQFADSVILEIEETGKLTKDLGMHPYTVYLGGGTPTALSPDELERVILALKSAFPGDWREFTVEAGRPDTITHEHIHMMKRHGVSRISVNPQTMHEQTLKAIGRRHGTEDIKTAVSLVRRYKIPVLNMDLIIGLPGENASMVKESVQQVLDFSPENITVHVFSRKRASRFNEQRDHYSLPDTAEVIKMQNRVKQLLIPRYKPYYLYRQRGILGGLENIGYTTFGSECIYNVVMIEERHHILGLGGGATSKIINPDLTLENIASPKDVRVYFERLGSLLIRRKSALITALEKHRKMPSHLQ